METVLTAVQAQALCDAHEIDALLDNTEECVLLAKNNLELLLAYQAIQRIANDE